MYPPYYILKQTEYSLDWSSASVAQTRNAEGLVTCVRVWARALC